MFTSMSLSCPCLYAHAHAHAHVHVHAHVDVHARAHAHAHAHAHTQQYGNIARNRFLVQSTSPDKPTVAYFLVPLNRPMKIGGYWRLKSRGTAPPNTFI